MTEHTIAAQLNTYLADAHSIAIAGTWDVAVDTVLARVAAGRPG
jgi:hypothetical protein